MSGNLSATKNNSAGKAGVNRIQFLSSNLKIKKITKDKISMAAAVFKSLLLILIFLIYTHIPRIFFYSRWQCTSSRGTNICQFYKNHFYYSISKTIKRLYVWINVQESQFISGYTILWLNAITSMFRFVIYKKRQFAEFYECISIIVYNDANTMLGLFINTVSHTNNSGIPISPDHNPIHHFPLQ